METWRKREEVGRLRREREEDKEAESGNGIGRRELRRVIEEEIYRRRRDTKRKEKGIKNGTK